MDRINDPSAPNRRWVAKDPNVAGSGTIIKKDWLQGLDDELINLIEKAGLVPSSADLEQIYKAVYAIGLKHSNLLGGVRYGSLANIFSGEIIINGVRDISLLGDYSKVTVDSDFVSAGYLHLHLPFLVSNAGAMPFISISGYEYAVNKIVDEKIAGYLSTYYGVYHQTSTSNGNPAYFYRSTSSANNGKFYLRIKINTAYFAVMRIEAMDASNENPFTFLTINSGLLTAKELI